MVGVGLRHGLPWRRKYSQLRPSTPAFVLGFVLTVDCLNRLNAFGLGQGTRRSFFAQCLHASSRCRIAETKRSPSRRTRIGVVCPTSSILCAISRTVSGLSVGARFTGNRCSRSPIFRASSWRAYIERLVRTAMPAIISDIQLGAIDLRGFTLRLKVFGSLLHLGRLERTVVLAAVTVFRQVTNGQ